MRAVKRKEKYGAANSSLRRHFCPCFGSFQRRKVARQGCLWNGRSALFFDALRLAQWRAVWRLSAI
jgi:hypothetical protein